MKKYSFRRLFWMIVGNAVLGIGIGFFKVSGMGNDPSSAMVMAVADRLTLPFSVTLIAFNAVWFLAELLWGRRYIGTGTFFNWFLVGPFTDLLVGFVQNHFTVPESFLPRFGIMFIGILILGFGCSLYQTADMGISPYDSHSIIFSERTGKRYFWVRIVNDSLCVAAALAFGGLIGIGTLVCALGLGPFITAFNPLAKKLIGEK